MLLTVTQIAQRLAKPEQQAALRERIRHWTREGLIKPIGEKNPGTGHHRQYDEGVLADVAILDALAGLGAQVRDQHAVLLRARELIEEQGTEEISAFTKAGSIFYLSITNVGRGQPVVMVSRADPIKAWKNLKYSMDISPTTIYFRTSRSFRSDRWSKPRLFIPPL
jgi:hypothetical protein